MPPTRRWILALAGLVSMALALIGITMYPLNTNDLTTIVLYEIAVMIGTSLILLIAYKLGYTEPLRTP